MNQLVKRVTAAAHQALPPFQYRIQFIDKNSVEEATEFMIKHFLPNDNLDKTLGSSQNATAVADYHRDWSTRLRKGISLAAFLEDETRNKGPMISCLVLDIEKKVAGKSGSLELQQCLSENFRHVFTTLNDVMAKADVFTLYGCETIVLGYGLATAPEFQRRGVGGEVLRARSEVCRLTGIPVSAEVFDSEASQKLAQKCGYELLAELDLTDYSIDGKIVYPNPPWHVIKWMAIRYF